VKTALVRLDQAGSPTEILEALAEGARGWSDRAAIFVVAGQEALGRTCVGYALPETIEDLRIPLTLDTTLATAFRLRSTWQGRLNSSPATVHALDPLGRTAETAVTTPIVVGDRVVALLHCERLRDTFTNTQSEPLEVLAAFAGKLLTIRGVRDGFALLPNAAPEPAMPLGTRPPSTPKAPPAPAAEPFAALVGDQAAADELLDALDRLPLTPGRPEPPAGFPHRAPEPPPIVDSEEELPDLLGQLTDDSDDSGEDDDTLMATLLGEAPAPVSQQARADAQKAAHSLVADILAANELAVLEGRHKRDILKRLARPISVARRLYENRVPADVRAVTNFFEEELVRVLAAGDVRLLGGH
jgi:hypothetical protein